MSVAGEIIRQRKMLIRDGRRPSEVVLGIEEWHELLCDPRVVSCGIYPGHEGHFHEFYDLVVTPRPSERVRVLPSDWGGYAQGAARA